MSLANSLGGLLSIEYGYGKAGTTEPTELHSTGRDLECGAPGITQNFRIGSASLHIVNVAKNQGDTISTLLACRGYPYSNQEKRERKAGLGNMAENSLRERKD